MPRISISLRWKIMAMIALLTALITGGIGLTLLERQKQELLDNTFASVRREARTIAFLTSRAMLNNDDLAIADAFLNLKELPGFLYGRLVSTGKSNIHQTYNKEEFTRFSQYIKEAEFTVFSGNELEKIWSELGVQEQKDKYRFQETTLEHGKGLKLYVFSFQVVHPFELNNPPVMAVEQLIFSNEFALQKQAKMREQLFIGFLLFLGIGIAGSLVFSSLIVRPVRILSRGAEIVGKGDFSYQLPPLGHDELGRLALQFNQMTRDLKEGEEIKEAQRVAEEKRKVQDEQVRLAAQIQEGMNPKNFVNTEQFEIKGFSRAAMGVGGDYYDFQQLPDGRMAIIIADVSGKSFSGAMVMVLIQTIVTMYLRLFKIVQPNVILSTINHVMATQTIDKFATIQFCLYDPLTREIEFSNGGHGPLFVYRARDKICTISKIAGLPMGMDEDSDYLLARLKLAPGDMVMFFTDGVTEANGPAETNEEGQIKHPQFGWDRLIDKTTRYAGLNAEEIVAKIIHDVDEFRTDSSGNLTEQNDDITLMVFKTH